MAISSYIKFFDLMELGKLIDYVKTKKEVKDTATNICKKANLNYSPNILWKKINEQKDWFYEEYIDFYKYFSNGKRLIELNFKENERETDLKLKNIKFDVFLNSFGELMVRFFTERNIYLGELCITIHDINDLKENENELKRMIKFNNYKKILYIERIYVKTEFQNKGIGTYV